MVSLPFPSVPSSNTHCVSFSPTRMKTSTTWIAPIMSISIRIFTAISYAVFVILLKYILSLSISNLIPLVGLPWSCPCHLHAPWCQWRRYSPCGECTSNWNHLLQGHHPLCLFENTQYCMCSSAHKEGYSWAPIILECLCLAMLIWSISSTIPIVLFLLLPSPHS